MKFSLSRLKWKLYLIVARYFKFFANLSFRRWKPRVIAVTGSVGKTTLLNLLEVQLGARAHYSHDANSIYGIAFNLVGVDGVRGSKLRWLYLFLIVPLRSLWFCHKQEFFVVEIDGERPRETELLASWLKPEVTLWVSVGRTHAAHFDEQVAQGLFKNVDEAILHEFSYLPKYTQNLVIYNATDKNIQKVVSKIDIKTVGVEGRATNYQVLPSDTFFEVGGEKFHFSEPMPREVATQLDLMKGLADYLGEAVITDLSAYQQPPGRSSYFDGVKGLKLIDSSYNAHLMSMCSIIEMFEEMKTNQKWIVIGDVVEQGENEARDHTELGRVLRAAGFERYVLVGRRTQKYTYPELDEGKAVTFLKPLDALEYLKQELSGKETVLFKGSQYLEGIIEHLLKNSADVEHLPRQEAAAKKRRARWGL